MLNVNALQKTLSAMPLDRLQQYAQLHKNDPYVVAMALSVANTKKEAMAIQQGQAGQQQMPKVVDQDIAQIAPQQQPAPAMGAAQQLPENQGIGQLPAPNMQKMAEGGIVAFGDGGEVPRFSGQYGSRVGNMGGVSSIPYYFAGQSAERDRLNALPGEWWGDFTDMIGRGLDSFTAGTTIEAQRKEREAAKALAEKAANAPKYDAATQAKGEAALAAMRDAQDMGGVAALTKAPGATGAAGATNAAAPAGTGGIGNLAADTAGTKGFMKELEGYIGKREEAPKQADIERELEARQKPYMDKLTESIESQRDKLKTTREESIYMAMIKGGLAAAAGTSPNALTNIAKGGEAGIADLSDSLKELRKAAQEQHKMELELNKAKMDASTGNLKTAWDRQDKAKQIQADRDKLMATAFTNITDTITRANATVKAAGIGAGADQRMLEALGAAKPDSALVKGFNMKQEMLKRATLTETWSKLAYPTGNMGQPNEAFLARFPSAEVYIKEAMAAEQPGGGGAPGPNTGMQRTR